jgi:hypothetical protein
MISLFEIFVSGIRYLIIQIQFKAKMILFCNSFYLRA